MSHPQPPQRQPTPPETQRYVDTMHNAAIFMVIICPILALLPPRKPLNTTALVGMTAFSSNYLIREQSGRSIWQHITLRPAISTPSEVAAYNSNNNNNHSTSDTQKVSIMEETQSAAKTSRAAWKVQREKEIREELEEGKGIFDMITDQIWHVWRQGKKEGDDDDDGDDERAKD